MKNTILLLLTSISLTCYSQEHVIYFDLNKSDLKQTQVDELRHWISTKKTGTLNLYGYTDTTGTITYNRNLAAKRIEAVREQLAKLDSEYTIQETNYGEERSSGSLDMENRKVVIKVEEDIYQKRKPNYNASESIEIDNSKDTIITCKKGTRIFIPKNAFVLGNKKTLSTPKITFKVTEYYDVSEMIDANLTTQSDGKILETGGMIYVEAYSNNLKCDLDKNKQLGIQFGGNSASDSMQIFNGVIANDTINWKIPLEIEEVIVEDKVFFIVENMPRFNFGYLDEFNKYVSQTLRYPAVAAKMGIEGKVYVSFVVEASGVVSNVKVVRGISPQLDSAAVRVIQKSPTWIPGTQRGKSVRVSFTIPIDFKIGSESKLPVELKNATCYSENADTSAYYVSEKQIESYKAAQEFYLWTSKLNWINCDRFTTTLTNLNLKVHAESANEEIIVVFNNMRSIIRINNYDKSQKVAILKNIPANQKITIVSISMINGVTHFANKTITAPNEIIRLDYRKIDSQKIREELQLILK